MFGDAAWFAPVLNACLVRSGICKCHALNYLIAAHVPAALQIENPWARRAAKVAAAYQKALQPRLLVLVSLPLLVVVYNKVSDEPLPLLYEGCLLGGFLSYKLALLLKLIDDLTPKVRGLDTTQLAHVSSTVERKDASSICSRLHAVLNQEIRYGWNTAP